MMDTVNHGSQYFILVATIGYNISVVYSYFFCFRYIEIDYDTLYIKSTLPPFYRKGFLLNDIRKVIISTSDDNRLQIIQKNGIKYSFRTLLMKDNFMLCELQTTCAPRASK